MKNERFIRRMRCTVDRLDHSEKKACFSIVIHIKNRPSCLGLLRKAQPSPSHPTVPFSQQCRNSGLKCVQYYTFIQDFVLFKTGLHLVMVWR